MVDYGTRAANEIERVILEEGADTVGAICLGVYFGVSIHQYPTSLHMADLCVWWYL